MNKILYTLAAFAILLNTACGHFEELNTDKDSLYSSTAAMIATGQIKALLEKPTDREFYHDLFLSKHIAWGENMQTLQYNGLGRASFQKYQNVLNCQKMVELAPTAKKEAYQGLNLFIKANTLFHISMQLGDIPYSDALQGEAGNITPRYDSQKQVMLQILNDLDQALICFNNAHDNAVTIDGDFVFNGDPSKWANVTNYMKRKVLINLSKKTNDPDLNVIQRFQQTGTNVNGNLQLTYALMTSQRHPSYNNYLLYPILSTTVVDTLKKYNDYRLFYFAQPTTHSTSQGLTEDDFNSYKGIDPSLPFDEIQHQYANGQLSIVNSRYTTSADPGEPTLKLGAPEQFFILAEAALRKWIDDDPNTLYINGIKESLKFVANNTTDNNLFHHGKIITDDYINQFVLQSDLQLDINNFNDALNKIITQKYVANFMHITWDNYFDYRRTGFPKLPINPNTNRNSVTNQIPLRWMYEQREYDVNRTNLQNALNSQYNGEDGGNQIMWMLKDE